MVQTSTQRRNILIASIIVVGLLVSTVGGVILYNQLATTRISLSLTTNQTSILQGNSTKIPITISLKGNPAKVDLASEVNSTKIKCYFDPANSSSSFNSTLTVNVDDSAQGGNYALTIKASSPTTTANALCIITVLTRDVTVSGKINIVSTKWAVPQVDYLTFENTRTGEKVMWVPQIERIGPYGSIFDNNFSLTLRNQDFYYVTASYSRWTIGGEISSRSDVIGNLTVFSTARSNMMPGQDFLLTAP